MLNSIRVKLVVIFIINVPSEWLRYFTITTTNSSLDIKCPIDVILVLFSAVC